MRFIHFLEDKVVCEKVAKILSSALRSFFFLLSIAPGSLAYLYSYNRDQRTLFSSIHPSIHPSVHPFIRPVRIFVLLFLFRSFACSVSHSFIHIFISQNLDSHRSGTDRLVMRNRRYPKLSASTYKYAYMLNCYKKPY